LNIIIINIKLNNQITNNFVKASQAVFDKKTT